MNVTANIKLTSTSKSSFQSDSSSFKSSKNCVDSLKTLITKNLSIPETILEQPMQQIPIEETCKLVGLLKFHDTILTELEKDVKHFAGGNLVKTGMNTPGINIP